MIKAKDLKHAARVLKPNSYTSTGQASDFSLLYIGYFGIADESSDDTSNEGRQSEKTRLSLFTRFDVRLQNGQHLSLLGKTFKVSNLVNVEFSNQRLNMTATEV